MEKRIKKSYICKDIVFFDVDEKNVSGYIPKVGDVAIFEVISIGKHHSMQDDQKRNCAIYPGDWVMASFGTRYATEQFEGYVPAKPMTEYHILGAGGTVGIIHSMHAKFRHVGPTRLRMIGYAVDRSGTVLNTKWMKQSICKSFTGNQASLTRIILSIGSSMDSGKTTTAAHMVRGFKNAGFRTGFIKLTGTVYTKDCDLAYDNGADIVADFSDLGYPSTYMCTEHELLDIFETLLSKINAQDLDFVVMEIADGIFQRETEMLLKNASFMSCIDSVVFSASDSLAAVQGVKELEAMNIHPRALCGLFTASPLLVRELRNRVNLPVLTIEQMAGGDFVQITKRSRRVIA